MQEVRLPDYLPWTEAELGNIVRALKRYKALGMEASGDIEKSGKGVVILSLVDLKVPNAPIVIFEVHKLKRADTGLRAHWVVQMQSVGGEQQTLTRHGCISAGSAVFAIAKAEQDAQSGFSATDTFDVAADAYRLKV